MPIKTDSRGFTLIETIVVVVIVAILAAVGIPQYIGYVNAQRQTTVDNLAETAAAAANTILRRTGAPPAIGLQVPRQPPLNLYFNNTKYDVNIISATQLTVTDKTKTTFTKTLNFN